MMLTFRRSRKIKALDVVDCAAVSQVAKDQAATFGTTEAHVVSHFFLFCRFPLTFLLFVLFGFSSFQ